MSQNPHVRSMRLADLPDVLRIQAVCYTELVPESIDSFRSKVEASPSTCFVASIEGEIVGYLIALLWDYSAPPELNAQTCCPPDSPNCLYLHDLAVLPAARKAGAGALLVNSFFDALQRSTLRRASLIAVQDSARYWERFGFRVASVSDSLRSKIATYGSQVNYMERLA